jgi:paraquat-inducible protein A
VHPAGTAVCARCGAALASRDRQSLQRVWAWLAAGLIAYVPANLLPMLVTLRLGKTTENTILGGVVELVQHGSWGVALIVFTASVLIPIGKFIAISYLALSIGRSASLGQPARQPARQHARQRLYEVVDFIGRWSMIDVFVVAILVALVQFDFVATIKPGIAAASFALSVAFTMLSAQSFDPKSLWDTDEAHET